MGGGSTAHAAGSSWVGGFVSRQRPRWGSRELLPSGWGWGSPGSVYKEVLGPRVCRQKRGHGGPAYTF